PAIRSEPTSCGLRYFTFNPVFTPAWRINGSQSKYFTHALRMGYSAGGTTEQMATRRTTAGSMSFSRRTAGKKTPNSSEEPRGCVGLRDWKFIPASNRAPCHWGFPMSRQRSMDAEEGLSGSEPHVVDEANPIDAHRAQPHAFVILDVVDLESANLQVRRGRCGIAGVLQRAGKFRRVNPPEPRQAAIARA